MDDKCRICIFDSLGAVICNTDTSSNNRELIKSQIRTCLIKHLFDEELKFKSKDHNLNDVRFDGFASELKELHIEVLEEIKKLQKK